MSLFPDFVSRTASRSQCSTRATAGGNCSGTPTWHVIWQLDAGKHSLACDGCMAYVRSHFVFYAAHRTSEACGRKGAIYLPDENRCVLDTEEIDVVAEAEEVLASLERNGAALVIGGKT